MAVGEAPGKLILFGEHSVAYGQPALGVALSKKVRVSLRRGEGRVTIRLAEGLRFPSDTLAAAPGALVKAALGADAEGIDADVLIELPPAAGLGSSAALAVALLRAKRALYGEEPLPFDQLLARAIAVEDLAHGRSSGLDPAISILSNVVEFVRRPGRTPRSKAELKVKTLAPAESFHVVVGVLGHHGGTATRVRAIAQLKERLGAPFDAAMRALGSTARSGIRGIAQGDLETAGRAANLAHGILSGLGLVSDEMEEIVRTARNAGAVGAKMSGAGGARSAFFGLASDIRMANDVLTAIERAGAIGFVETAAG